MHLKNFSLITRDNKVEFSPAYDLLNTAIVVPRTQEEIALPIAGKKRNLSAKILIDYFAQERLKLNDIIISQVLNKINSEWNNWENLIMVSFLSIDMKEKYLELMKSRKQIVGL